MMSIINIKKCSKLNFKNINNKSFVNLLKLKTFKNYPLLKQEKKYKSNFIANFLSYNFCEQLNKSSGYNEDEVSNKIDNIENIVFNDRINYRYVEQPLINKLTSDIYNNQNICLSNNIQKKLWINQPQIIDLDYNSINHIHKLIVADVINRIKLQNNHYIINNLYTNNIEDNNKNSIISNLKSIGILFNENNLNNYNVKDLYLHILNNIIYLNKSDKLKLSYTTVFWNLENNYIVDKDKVDEINDLGTSCFVEMELINKDLLINNLRYKIYEDIEYDSVDNLNNDNNYNNNNYLDTNEDAFTNKSSKNQTKKNRFFNYFSNNNGEDFLKILENNINFRQNNMFNDAINNVDFFNYKIFFIGFIIDPWKYIGINSLEVNYQKVYCAFIIKNDIIDKNLNKLNHLKNKIYITSYKRLSEITKRIGLKLSEICIIYQFNGDLLSKNSNYEYIQAKDPLFNRKIPIIVNSNVTEFYGTGINILTPGHDLNHEKSVQKEIEEIDNQYTQDNSNNKNSLINNFVNYKGYIDNKGQASDLEIYTIRNINNDYIIKQLSKSKSILSIYEYNSTYYIDKENNSKVIIKTIPSLNININKKLKTQILANLKLIKSYPPGKLENKSLVKVKKNHKVPEDPNSYMHMVEKLDSKNSWTLSIYNKDNNTYNNCYQKFVVPVLFINNEYINNNKNFNTNNKVYLKGVIDNDIIKGYIKYVENSKNLIEIKVFPNIEVILKHSDIPNDKHHHYKLFNIEYMNLSDDFIKSNIYDFDRRIQLIEILNLLKNNNLELNKLLYNRNILSNLNKIKYLKYLSKIKSKNIVELSSVEEFLEDVFPSENILPKLKEMNNILQSKLYNNNIEEYSTDNITNDIFIIKKQEHQSNLIYNTITNHLLYKKQNFENLKTVGNIISKRGDISTVDYLDIVNGVETFDFFKDYPLKDNSNSIENKNNTYGYGADTLRLILSANDEDKDIILLETDLSNAKQDLRTIRRISKQLKLIIDLVDYNIEDYTKNNSQTHKKNSNFDNFTKAYNYNVIDYYKKKSPINYKHYTLYDKWILYNYHKFIIEIEELLHHQNLKTLINTCLSFIKNYANNYILITLRRLTDISDNIFKLEKTDNKTKQKEQLENIYLNTLINTFWINVQLITSIVYILSSIVPFTTQFIYNNIYLNNKNNNNNNSLFVNNNIWNSSEYIEEILIENFPFISNKNKEISSKLYNDKEDLESKFKMLTFIQQKVRKFTVSMSKHHYIPLKELSVAIEVNVNSLEENLLFVSKEDLKWFFNVNEVLLIYSEDELLNYKNNKKEIKYKTLFSEEIKIKEKEVLGENYKPNNDIVNTFEFKCYVLCSIDYLENNPYKNKLNIDESEVPLYSKNSYGIKEGKKTSLNKNLDNEYFEEPFSKQKNNTIDKFYVDLNKKI